MDVLAGERPVDPASDSASMAGGSNRRLFTACDADPGRSLFVVGGAGAVLAAVYSSMPWLWSCWGWCSMVGVGVR